MKRIFIGVIVGVLLMALACFLWVLENLVPNTMPEDYLSYREVKFFGTAVKDKYVSISWSATNKDNPGSCPFSVILDNEEFDVEQLGNYDQLRAKGWPERMFDTSTGDVELAGNRRIIIAYFRKKKLYGADVRINPDFDPSHPTVSLKVFGKALTLPAPASTIIATLGSPLQTAKY